MPPEPIICRRICIFFSNDLHEMLMEKDTVSFWETWNSKMVKNKMSAVIVESDKFTRHFQQNWSSHNNNHPVSYPGSALMPDIVGYSASVQHDDFMLLDVESVNKCLLDMHKCKAPGDTQFQGEPLQWGR